MPRFARREVLAHRAAPRLTVEMLGEVVLFADLPDDFYLRLYPVDVFLGIREDVLEDFARAVILLGKAQLDAALEVVATLDLKAKVSLEHLRDALANLQLAQPLKVGQAVEEQDAIHEGLRVLHLLDGFLVDFLGEALETPMPRDARMEEVLVYGGELVGEDLIEHRDDVGIALHTVSLLSSGWSTGIDTGGGTEKQAMKDGAKRWVV